MIYPERIVQNELMWEYGYTAQQAQSVIDIYKSQDKYTELCNLIQYRMSLQSSKDVLCQRIQG